VRGAGEGPAVALRRGDPRHAARQPLRRCPEHHVPRRRRAGGGAQEPHVGGFDVEGGPRARGDRRTGGRHRHQRLLTAGTARSTVLEQRCAQVTWPRRWGPWLAVAAALALLYVPTYISLAHGLWHDDEYAHGPLVLAIAALLVWRDRAALVGG